MAALVAPFTALTAELSDVLKMANAGDSCLDYELADLDCCSLIFRWRTFGVAGLLSVLSTVNRPLPLVPKSVFRHPHPACCDRRHSRSVMLLGRFNHNWLPLTLLFPLINLGSVCGSFIGAFEKHEHIS
jgi:hypothetical protein